MKEFLVRLQSKTVLAFAVVFAIGLAGFIYPADCPWQEFIRALRDALMVAGVIGAFIDIWSASVLVGHAADQLSERLVGYGLPKSAQDKIHALVHETKIVRRGYQATYRINPAASGYVTLGVRISFDAVNNGSSTEVYRPCLEDESIYDPRIQSLEFGDKICVPGRTVNDETKVVSWTPEYSFKLAPSRASDAIESLSENQKCRVRWDYVLTMREDYTTVLAFSGLTVNPVVEITDLPPGFEFHATRDECHHADGSSTWEYRRAFLPGQAVRVWWRPRAAIPSQSAPKTS